MTRPAHTMLTKKIPTWLGSVALAIVLLVSWRLVHAQAAAPQITSVNLTSVSGTSATVSFTTDDPAGGRIAYDIAAHDQVSQYANVWPTGGTYDAETTSHTLTLGAPPNTLEPSITYHYRIEVKNANGTTASADRTFTTRSGTGGGTALTITNLVADCLDTRCQLRFSTSRSAKVEIRWDTSQQADFGAYPNSAAEQNFTADSRSLLLTGLTANQRYYYRARATGDPATGGGEFTTNELQFSTSANPFDHVFTTGACSDGTAIGSCSPSGAFCAPGGNLNFDCSSICGYTCRSGTTCSAGGVCLQDPQLTGSPYQCNNASCYEGSGAFKTLAPAGCYASWPRCNANTILKVKKDRGCNLWLTCATSLQTEPAAGAPAENLCLSLAACNSLNQQGQCNNYLPPGQCDNDPLRFCSTDADCQAGGSCNNSPVNNPTQSLRDLTVTAPDQVKTIADLSGNVTVGLDWAEQGGASVIQGYLPWQLMRQIGGNGQIENGDFEEHPPLVTPWVPAPLTNFDKTTLTDDFENKDASPNHVLFVQPDTERTLTIGKCKIATTSSCISNANCTGSGDSCVFGTAPINFSGAASNEFFADPAEYYYAEARIRASDGNPRVRLQFGYRGYTAFAVGATATSVDVTATDAWQRVTLGPIIGLSGLTRVAAVCADIDNCSPFQVDDVQVRPILQVDTNPDYLSSSCRLYPKSDAPACDYIDPNGVKYKGWRGYCLEHDSQTGTCLSWWPVDIIKGENNLFGAPQTAGYQGRVPLYLCAETDAATAGPFSTAAYTTSEMYSDTRAAPNCNFIGDRCESQDNLFDDPKNHPYTIAQCNDHVTRTCEVTSTKEATQLTELDISRVSWSLSTQLGVATQQGSTYVDSHVQTSIMINNSSTLQSSNPANPAITEDDPPDTNGRVQFRHKTYRDASSSSDFIFWWYKTECLGGNGCNDLNNDAVSVGLKFSKTTGRFVSYLLEYTLARGSAGRAGVGYKVVFYRQPACTKLVQVVTPTGENTAFSGRINSSNYQVPDLNYGQTTDLSPFGGALAPVTGGNGTPDQWQTKVYAQQPNYTQIPAPGQARAGAPYACNGQCADVVCTVDGSSCLTDGALDQTLVRNCQKKDVDNDGVGDGECVGVAASAATNRGDQTFAADHDATKVNPPSGTTAFPYYAQERIRRLFAKSYGVWSDLRCSNSPTTACNTDSDCSFSGGNTGTCSIVDLGYLPVATAQDWVPPTEICAFQQQAGVCSTSSVQCPRSTTGQVTGVSSACLIGCNGDAMKQQAINDGIARCKATTACDGTTAACPGSGTTVKFTGGSGDPANCQTVPASFPSVGVTQQCTVTCTLSTATSYQQATVVQSPQTKATRGDFPNDYCAVPPELSCPGTNCQPGQLASFLNGRSTTTTVSGGSGNVTIMLNINTDREQTPLRTLQIDWGDGVIQPVPAQKPYIFSKVYVCTGGQTCSYEIRVQAKDNWGWCNDAVKNGSATAMDGVADTACQPRGAWAKTGLKVIVQP